MTFDPDTDLAPPELGPDLPCPFVKITQLLGEVHCYLVNEHDGKHCSVDWMEWS